jgi:hypothetical protein
MVAAMPRHEVDSKQPNDANSEPKPNKHVEGTQMGGV